jgi:hypothetical protein
LQDIEAARQEASENVKFLKPLRRFLEKINTMDDFVALADQFKPLLHVMLLIWKHSSSYSSSARFATLLREVCNDLIMQVGALLAAGITQQISSKCCGNSCTLAAASVGQQAALLFCPRLLLQLLLGACVAVD